MISKLADVRVIPGLLLLSSVGESAQECGKDGTRWLMGRGDKRTKKGKIFRGSYGKCRPKPEKLRRLKESRIPLQVEEPVAVPEPPQELATPPSLPPVVDGLVWDLSDEPFHKTLSYSKN
eukprot:g4501.t1